MTNSDRNWMHVSVRTDMGKKVSKIRKMGLVPGNIFGEEKESESISIGKSDLIRFLKA
ncbi:MAG: Ribosomal L25p family, partial [Patescibacteria group bacterium]|nr:Ribosomal L25p family [Patescibacteria group bacterium]